VSSSLSEGRAGSRARHLQAVWSDCPCLAGTLCCGAITEGLVLAVDLLDQSADRADAVVMVINPAARKVSVPRQHSIFAGLGACLATAALLGGSLGPLLRCPWSLPVNHLRFLQLPDILSSSFFSAGVRVGAPFVALLMALISRPIPMAAVPVAGQFHQAIVAGLSLVRALIGGLFLLSSAFRAIPATAALGYGPLGVGLRLFALGPATLFVTRVRSRAMSFNRNRERPLVAIGLLMQASASLDRDYIAPGVAYAPMIAAAGFAVVCGVMSMPAVQNAGVLGFGQFVE